MIAVIRRTLTRLLSEWIAKIVVGILIIAIILLGMKGQIIIPWSSPALPVSYSIFGKDGRSMQVILLPENKVLVWYYDEHHDYTEGTLVRWHGYVGTHYFLRIWNIGDPEEMFGQGVLGIRIYPEGIKPVVLDTEVLKHYIHGAMTPTLPSRGDRIRQQTVLFGSDVIRFQDMWLQKDDESKKELDEDISGMLTLLDSARKEKK